MNWISVRDRPPEDQVEVLEQIVYTVGDRAQKPYKPRRSRFKNAKDRAKFNAEVTRWLPMPELPKEEK